MEENKIPKKLLNSKLIEIRIKINFYIFFVNYIYSASVKH